MPARLREGHSRLLGRLKPQQRKHEVGLRRLHCESPQGDFVPGLQRFQSPDTENGMALQEGHRGIPIWSDLCRQRTCRREAASKYGRLVLVIVRPREALMALSGILEEMTLEDVQAFNAEVGAIGIGS